MADEPEKKPDEELLLELNFVPSWARQPAGENPYADYAGSDRSFRGPRPERGGGPRPSSRDRGPDRRERRGPPAGGRRERRPEPGGGMRPMPRPDTRPGVRPERPRPEPSPFDISFLPDRQNLGGAVRRIHQTRRAFPLAQLAHMFLSRPTLYLVKLEARTVPNVPPARLFQCTACQAVFTRREEFVRHVPAAHVGDFFEVVESSGEPVTGQFVCVARCPRSGRLLGPPNHHSFAEAVAELHAEQFAHLTVDEFRGSLEMVHDAAVIETWKQEYGRRKIYRLKSAGPDAAPMKGMEARAYLRNQAAGLLKETGRAVIPASVAIESSDPGLRRAIRDAWTMENRFPRTLMLALRPALRHMDMHFFKAGSVTFVTAVHPAPINPDFAVPAIRDAVRYLAGHPGVTRAQMLEELFPGAPAESEDRVALERNLQWLIEKGHVIEFFDHTLALPRGGTHVAREALEAPAAE